MMTEAPEPKRNPDWTREETILALDLYVRRRPQLPDETDAEIVALSELLLRFARQRGVRGKESFRNPTGVSMKLGNLRRLDGGTAGTGLTNGSKIEDQVWADFAADPQALHAAAEAIRSDIYAGAALDVIHPEQPRSPQTEAGPQRIWVTGMWGYSPDVHAYVGFTNPGPRERYLAECRPGDLMMIVGQRGAESDPRDVGRLLGIVELDPKRIEEKDGMSPEAYAEKVAKFGLDRWRHAMPVLRAWKIGREVIASQVASTTCAARNARALGASCMLLTDEEVERVLALPVRPWKVWGRPEWAADADSQKEVRASVAVSKGPRPSFGPVTYDRQDGETKLYLMRLEGPLTALFPSRSLFKQAVIKVGRSNDVKRRCEELNCGFPPGSQIRWRVTAAQPFGSADDAHDAEQRLLSSLEARGWAIGKEFAIVPEREIDTLLASAAEKSAFLIKG